MTRRATIAVMAVVAPLLLGIDLYLAADKLPGNTYSEILRGWFSSLRWLYYVTGFLALFVVGHWLPKSAEHPSRPFFSRGLQRLKRNWAKVVIVALFALAGLVAGAWW